LTHQVTITDYKQLADGICAIQTSCCGDPKSLSWLSMASEVAVDPVRREDSINFHVNRVALLHETTLQALNFLPTLVGTASMISFPSPAQPTAPVSPDPAPTTPSTPDPSVSQNPGA
jgi:hypothetical protein